MEGEHARGLDVPPAATQAALRALGETCMAFVTAFLVLLRHVWRQYCDEKGFQIADCTMQGFFSYDNIACKRVMVTVLQDARVRGFQYPNRLGP